MSDRPLTAKPLSERELRFVDALLGTAQGKAALACKIAGYKGNSRTLTNQAARLMAKERIQREIAARRTVITKDAILTAQELQVWLSGVVWGTVTESVTVSQKTPKGASDAEADNFVEVEQAARIRDRIPAAALLAKLAGYDQPPKDEALVVAAPPSAELQAALIEFAKSRADEETWQAFLRWREMDKIVGVSP